ncbi:MAG: hypothetical protein ACRDT8_02575, partial [Micromonosporaceae bacterium]
MNALLWGRLRAGIFGNAVTTIAVATLALLLLAAVFAPWLAPASPDAQ